MSVELLLEACRIEPEDSQLTPEIIEDLSAVHTLVQQCKPHRHGGHLPHAVTLLTAALGRMPRFNPTHLPFGFGGPRLKSRQWVDVDRIDLILTQIIGLCQPSWDIHRVTFESQEAVADAASLGLIEKKEYDGWLPGMPTGSGWRIAVSATPYGTTRARQAVAQCANPPKEKEPQYPWRKASPPLAPVQASVPAAVVTPASSPTEPRPVETGSNVVLLSPPPPALNLVMGHLAQAQRGKPTILPVDDRYAWARQVELVRATNQVLGEGELNPGVLSKACKSGEITTNRKCGRGALVEVKSFLAWLGKKRELPKEEIDQVRNAIIGEICSRK